MNDWFEAENRVERAHELYEAGRWEEAESLLREALSLNPYHAEWHFNLGLTLDASGRFDEAVESFARAFELSTRDAQPAMMAGSSCVRAERYRDAVVWFERATEVDPRNVGSFVNRIHAYARLGDHEQSELMFYLAQQLDPDYPDAFVELADSLLDRGLCDKAVWCLREAARIDPELPRIQARLAEAYARTGRHERARQLYLRELRTDPGDFDTLLDLGELLLDMNRLAEAGEKFRRVLEIQPDNADAHFNLGDLWEREHAYELAISHLDVVVRLDAEYPGARRRLASLLLDHGTDRDSSRIRDLLLREVAWFRRDDGAFTAEETEELGGLLLDAGLPGDSVRVFRRLAQLRPNSVRAHHDLSVALFEVGNLSGGIEEARRALRLDPRFVPAMYNMAFACMQRRQWRRARYWIHQARTVDSDDPSVRRLLLLLRLHTAMEIIDWTGCVLLRRRRRRPRAMR